VVYTLLSKENTKVPNKNPDGKIERSNIHPNSWYFIMPIILLFTAVLFSQLFILLYSSSGAIPSGKNLINITSTEFLLITATQAIVFILVISFYVKKFNIPIFDVKAVLKIRVILIAFLGIIIFLFFISILVKLFDIHVKQFKFININIFRKSSFSFYLATSIIAPIYEEYVFRGVILGSILKIKKDPSKLYVVLSLIFSSFLFAIVHFDFEAFLPIFFLGLYLGALALYRQNIMLPITIHLLNNLLATTNLLYPEIFPSFSFFR